MEKQPTPEEIAKNQEARTLSDAELIKGGARYVPTESGEPRLEVTREQRNEAKKEMVQDYETTRRQNMSEKEIKIEMEQKIKKTVQIIAEIVKGEIIKTPASNYFRIETKRDWERDYTDRKKTNYTFYLSLNKDGNIVVDYNAYFAPDIFNHYSDEFSSIFTPQQIARTAEIFFNFFNTGYGGEFQFHKNIREFKDRVERGEK